MVEATGSPVLGKATVRVSDAHGIRPMEKKWLLRGPRDLGWTGL